MKKNVLSIMVAAFFAGTAVAQMPATIDFETVGTDSAWYMFANGTDNPAYCAVADNPDDSGINSSAKVGILEVVDNANPWAGIYSTTAVTPFLWDADNSIVKVMVYKNVISDFDLKFEAENSGDWAQEKKVANTVTDEWEELTFDFSEYIGNGIEVARIVIIPDFPESRTAGSVCYFDNIDFGAGSGSSVKFNNVQKLNLYPNPASEKVNVEAQVGATIEVYNVAGQLVVSQVATSKLESVNVSNLAAGVYTVRTGDKASKLLVK
jgi:hypothetical protein